MPAPAQASATPRNKLFDATGSVSCEKVALPPSEEDVSPPPSRPEKLKIKSKPSSGFGCHPAQRLAGSTAPTFHDFRTFPKLGRLQGEQRTQKPLVTGGSAQQTRPPSSPGRPRAPRGGPSTGQQVHSGHRSSSSPSFLRKGNQGREGEGKGPNITVSSGC